MASISTCAPHAKSSFLDRASSSLFGGTDVGKDNISAALEAVKADRAVKTPNGQRLLEVCS